MYDYNIYYLAMRNVFHGLLPWASGVDFLYPPLSVLPMMIAYVISLAGGETLYFVIAMWALMITFDIISTLCVYYIGLKLYSERTAFVAAMLNATALSVAYFTLTRFDAFPTCLAMLAVLATVYDDRTKGYLASIAGLFVKLWPILLFPFFWLYNSRNSSIIAEGKNRAIVLMVAGGAAFAFMLLAGYSQFLGYADKVYCNTIPYAISQYLNLVGLAIPFSVISITFRILTVVVVLGSLYVMYKRPKTINLMLKLILITLMATIFFSQYRSPQYIMWFTPFAALLIAADFWGILIFVGLQVFGYIEFPLGFFTLYTNDHYTSPWTLPFFSLLFLGYGLLLWRAMKLDDPIFDNIFPKKSPKKSR